MPPAPVEVAASAASQVVQQPFLKMQVESLNTWFAAFLGSSGHMFVAAALAIMSMALASWISMILRSLMHKKKLTPKPSRDIYEECRQPRNDQSDTVPLRVMKQLHALKQHPLRDQWQEWEIEDSAITAGISYGEQRYLAKLEAAALNVMPLGLLCTVLSLMSILPAIGRAQFPGLLAWKLLFTAAALLAYLSFGRVIASHRKHLMTNCSEAVQKFKTYESTEKARTS